MLAVNQESTYLSIEDYLKQEEAAEFKSEYYDGGVFPMAGASINHNQIVGNLYASFNIDFRGKPYRVFMSDMRLWLPIYKRFTYPDVMVVAGNPNFALDRQDTITNPDIIIEVLSESTEGYDRGEKFKMYRSLESVKEYILVSQSAIQIEHFIKNPQGQWLLHSDYGAVSKVLDLVSVNLKIPLSEVYDKVAF